MGWDWPFAIQPYDDAWRARHRVFRNLMRSLRGDIILTRLRVATNYSIVSLINLIDGPNIFDSRYLFNGMGYYLTGGFVSLTGALTMDVMYGIEVLPENDPYINTAEKSMASLAEAVIPGSFLADFLPTCMRTLSLLSLVLTDSNFSEICACLGSGCWVPNKSEGME